MALIKALQETHVGGQITKIAQLRTNYGNTKTQYVINEKIKLEFPQTISNAHLNVEIPEFRKICYIYYNGYKLIRIRYGFTTTMVKATMSGLTLGFTGGTIDYLTKDKTINNAATTKEISQALKEATPKLEMQMKQEAKEKWGK